MVYLYEVTKIETLDKKHQNISLGMIAKFIAFLSPSHPHLSPFSLGFVQILQEIKFLLPTTHGRDIDNVNKRIVYLLIKHL